ncbi:MAG: hypothetical protein GYB68_18040 [Chloroflexi bacterium]|nr:hypothetical protein [Chloroflexota bacterium]
MQKRPEPADQRPVPLDFATTWTQFTQVNMQRRTSDAASIVFWQQNATGYDASIQCDPDSYREMLNAIPSLLHPEGALLAVGAAKGRFALSLAGSRAPDLATFTSRLASFEQPAAQGVLYAGHSYRITG